MAVPDAVEYRTAPPEALDASLSVAIVGDTQMTSGLVLAATNGERNEDAQARLFADLAARRESLAALVIVGDLVYTARSRRDWRHFDSLVRPFAAELPVLPALGNHDYHCWFVHLCTQRVVPRNVRLRFPWLAPGVGYWVPFGDVALVFLDSETGIEAQAVWLDELLARLAASRAAVVVFAHRPPYTHSTARGLEPDLELREHVVPVLARHDQARLFVSGHAHGYEHVVVDGVHYVVSGGAGGPRSALAPERPGDAYAGPDCATTPTGAVLRPFNYLLLRQTADRLDISVRGFCGDAAEVGLLESFSIAK